MREEPRWRDGNTGPGVKAAGNGGQRKGCSQEAEHGGEGKQQVGGRDERSVGSLHSGTGGSQGKLFCSHFLNLFTSIN